MLADIGLLQLVQHGGRDAPRRADPSAIARFLVTHLGMISDICDFVRLCVIVL